MSEASSSRSVAAGSSSAALITGASSGIGAEFARRLAALGHDLVLIGRRKARLDAVAADASERHGVDVDVQVADLADPRELDRLERLIAERGPLEYLINNAGFGTVGRFGVVAGDKHVAMLRVHIEAPVRFTRAALPKMKEVDRGRIINVSSVAGLLRSPGSTIYSATKTFLNAFSETLAMELRHTGVRVQALCPGFTITEFHDREEFAEWDRASVPKMLWMSVEDVVDISLKGLERGEVICITGLRYKLLVLAARNRLLRKTLRPLARKRVAMADRDK